MDTENMRTSQKIQEQKLRVTHILGFCEIVKQGFPTGTVIRPVNPSFGKAMGLWLKGFSQTPVRKPPSGLA